jgi:hypothetical protein
MFHHNTIYRQGNGNGPLGEHGEHHLHGFNLPLKVSLFALFVLVRVGLIHHRSCQAFMCTTKTRCVSSSPAPRRNREQRGNGRTGEAPDEARSDVWVGREVVGKLARRLAAQVEGHRGPPAIHAHRRVERTGRLDLLERHPCT